MYSVKKLKISISQEEGQNFSQISSHVTLAKLKIWGPQGKGRKDSVSLWGC